jgi:hypothetical protein
MVSIIGSMLHSCMSLVLVTANKVYLVDTSAILIVALQRIVITSCE